MDLETFCAPACKSKFRSFPRLTERAAKSFEPIAFSRKGEARAVPLQAACGGFATSLTTE